MTRRYWAGVIAAVVISVVGIGAAAFVLNARAPEISPRSDRSDASDAPPPDLVEPDDEAIRGQAKDFLRMSAGGDAITACLMVIDNGGITNPCVDDLNARADYRRLAELDPQLEVTGFDRKGDVATITGKHLRPTPAVKFSIEVVYTDRGEWKVRTLNGRPIVFEGDFEVR